MPIPEWLLAEWADSNAESPDAVSSGSNLKAAWVGGCGHTWDASVKNRVRGAGCPFCAGKRAWPGFNDLASQRPDLAEEWHADNPKTPEETVVGSRFSALWQGACGHQWNQPVYKRVERGDGCPYCAKAGTKILPGFNDLETKFPHIAAQWHPSKNDRPPSTVFPAARTRYWWLGGCGHEWQSTVANRTHNKSGCPYCAGNPRVLKGFNDLATIHPHIAAQWHPTRNGDAAPSEFTSGTSKYAWWICKSGHEWRATIGSRSSGTSCPYCAGKLPVSGVSDLASTRPDVAQEWSESNTLTASDVTSGSSRRVWWICPDGHEWRATVQDRTRGDGKHTGCPTCAASTYVSRAETEVAEFVRSLGADISTSYRDVPGVREVDIAVVDKRIGVEFNGLYWHSEKVRGARYHYDKTLAAQRQGWAVLHVWEDDWRVRRPIVERMIARKLGVSNEPRLNARSLQAGYATPGESREFLDANHIQGATPGSARLALRDDSGAIRALMLFRRRKGGAWELSRYATDAIVRGGFTRLLKRFIAEYAPDKIVTFSDNATSDGSLYEGSGFVRDGEIPPDYMYIVKGTRVHKFNYRLKRFRDDPNLEYREGATERELADLNGLDRIYDAGKVRWVLTLR